MPKDFPIRSCETEFEALGVKTWLREKAPNLTPSIIREAKDCYTVVVPEREQMLKARKLLVEARTEPIAGDLLRVKTSDDVLIAPESFGVVEKVYMDEAQATFNFYTPWRVAPNVVQASGGPVRIIKLAKIKPTSETRTVEELVAKPSIELAKTVKREVKVFNVSLL